MSRALQADRPGKALPVARGPKRRLEIVKAAEQVFLEHGFADTTMLMVAHRAGASKETLYRHFGSKEDLFAEIIESRSKWLSQKLDSDNDRPHAMADVLRDLGTRLLTSMTDRDILRLFRVVLAEAHLNPHLGRLFLRYGPERTQARLATYLEGASSRGEFRGSDPQRASRLFLSAVLASNPVVTLLLDEPLVMSVADIDAQVAEAVSMFIAHYG